ncbi:MAG TPA: phosphoribosylformylglycinamidine cyclo-ligase [Thermoplasmata archaeon]|nr:phosphoribosylformylglycinamidine cyclo-ligase [Thermoplasmata archaeon]
MPRRRASAWSYARAGVSRSAVAEALAALLRTGRYRAPASSGRPLELAGHYAGLVRIGRETLALTTDTIGTKGLLAQEMGRWEEVGEDVVAINVNDLAAVGARPSALVDTISLGRPDPATLASIGRGLRRGLRAAGCSLLGGETAVVPELVQGVDLGATALGFYPRGRHPITGAGIRPGDELWGLPSSGLHANGLTLARRIVRERRLALRLPRPAGRRPLGIELLAPTRCYVPAVEAIADLRGVTGLAHISGGGVRNLSRLHPHVEFRLDGWPEPPSLFRFLAESGSVAPREMYQTFNMGIGFVVACRPALRRVLLRRWRAQGTRDPVRLGTVVRGSGVSLPQLGLSFEGYG